MTPEVCQQIANLLGQRPLSELPFGDNSPVTGEYVVYKQGNSNLYRIASTDIYTYFCRKVFWFVFNKINNSQETETSCIVLNPQRYIQAGDTPITYARRLLDVVNNPNEEWTGRWIGDPAPAGSGTNISQEWFKHFQYYYFDNLNNRQRTMLLNYKDGEIEQKSFDILIWLDASTSMLNKIQDIAQSVDDLCGIIFAQNPHNRISIVQFQRQGYYPSPVPVEEQFTQKGSYKGQCHHLPFKDGSHANEITSFLRNLANWFENQTGFFDENAWFLSRLTTNDYQFVRPSQNHSDWPWEDFNGWEGENMEASWRPGWEETRDGKPVHKMIIAVSDEIADPYISITGKVATPYQPGTDVNNKNNKSLDVADFDTANWVYRWRFSFNRDGQYRDPYGGYKDGNGVVHAFYPEFCNWEMDGNGYANSGAYPAFGYPGTVAEANAFDSLGTFINSFRTKNVQFHFIHTGASALRTTTRSQNPKEFEISRAYIYRFQKDIVDKLNEGKDESNKLGFLHLVTPTTVAEAVLDIFMNAVIAGLDEKWSNDMWYSHLNETTEQTLPGVWKTPSKYKHLVVPDTSIVRNSSKKTGYEFQKRNYTKIVTGGWTPGNTKDESWAAVSNATVEPSPEVNDDIYDGRGELVARNIGDIDQTIKVIGEFLDDVMLTIKPMEHAGQVVFTASTERNPLGIGWTNLISSDSDNESFVWSGNNSLKGENTNFVPGIPNHHHNTVFNGSNAMPIQNVSVVGRPEGETVGGVAKVDTAERLPTASYGKKEDTIHRLSNPGSALSGRGAYNGTVEYDAYEVGANQQSHNNMPLYYKMRAFVHD